MPYVGLGWTCCTPVEADRLRRKGQSGPANEMFVVARRLLCFYKAYDLSFRLAFLRSVLSFPCTYAFICFCTYRCSVVDTSRLPHDPACHKCPIVRHAFPNL